MITISAIVLSTYILIVQFSTILFLIVLLKWCNLLYTTFSTQYVLIIINTHPTISFLT